MKTNAMIPVLVAFLIVGYAAGASLATGPKGRDAAVSMTGVTEAGVSIHSSDRFARLATCGLVRGLCNPRRPEICKNCIFECGFCTRFWRACAVNRNVCRRELDRSKK